MTDRHPDPQAELWQQFVDTVRQDPGIPYEEQWARYNEIFADRDPTLPPSPAWAPDADRLEHANITTVMRDLGIDDYRTFHRWSIDHRADFWERAIARLGIAFSTQPDQILDLSSGSAQPNWLPGAQLNIVSSCFPEEDFEIAVVVGAATEHLTDVASHARLLSDD